jgi:hypothetical protein
MASSQLGVVAPSELMLLLLLPSSPVAVNEDKGCALQLTVDQQPPRWRRVVRVVDIRLAPPRESNASSELQTFKFVAIATKIRHFMRLDRGAN